APEMQLDTDLGIDSIKRVEILSAVQERLPGLPPLSPEALANLRSLQDIIDSLDGASIPLTQATAVIETTQPTPTQKGAASVDTAINIPVVPKALLSRSLVGTAALSQRRALDMPNDAAIRIVGAKNSFALEVAEILHERFSDTQLLAQTADADTKADLLILLPSAATTAEQWLAVVQSVRKALKQGGLLIGVCQLDGSFGLQGLPAEANPECAALCGLLKTAALEWVDLHIRILDAAPNLSAAALAKELLLQGPLETGLREIGACTVIGHSQTAHDTTKLATPIAPGEAVVITGGGRGIAVAVAMTMVREWQVELHLLGRSSLGEEPEWAQGAKDEASLQQAAAIHFKGEKPLAWRAHCRAILAQRELHQNLETLHSACAETQSSVHYHSVDVCDARAVSETIAAIGKPVRGLIHAAGVLADRLLAEQTTEQFRQVYATKVDGLKHLLDSTSDQPLNFITVFSSTTARYGRRGQAAYAAANETINKMTQREQTLRPECNCLAVNWGPWDGGMVKAELKSAFALEGIGLISLESGADCLLEELSAGTRGELTVLAKYIAPAECANVNLPLAFKLQIGLQNAPVLEAHILDGCAVVPLALSLEWLAQGALHLHPDLRLAGAGNLRLLKGLVLAEEESLQLRVLAGTAHMGDDGLRQVPVELRASTDPNAPPNLRGEIWLTENSAKDLPAASRIQAQDNPWSDRPLYAEGALFHGSALQGIESVLICDHRQIAVCVRTIPAPSEWLKESMRSQWLANPLLLDCVFQALILWSTQDNGTPCLPAGIGTYRQYCAHFPKNEEIFISASIVAHDATRIHANVDIISADARLLAQLTDCEAIRSAQLASAFARNRLAQTVLPHPN
ncbi:MAG: SDR family NAD(P)-dependent oxidoreductase, partial [Candidatus Eutrophobiaceae bacterium]